MSYTMRCGKPGTQSEPARPAVPEPLAAMIKLFTLPGKFCASDNAMRPPMEWPMKWAAGSFK